MTLPTCGPVRHEEGTPNDHWRCRCDDSRVVIKFNGGNGLTMCDRTGKVLFSGFPPGWAPPHFKTGAERQREELIAQYRGAGAEEAQDV